MAVSLGSQLSKLAAPISEPFAKCLPRLGDWSKNIEGRGGGWVGAFGSVVDKKHMTHPHPSAQK